MEDIKTMSDDISKSAGQTEEIKVGKRTVIEGKVYEWDGNEYKLVEDVK